MRKKTAKAELLNMEVQLYTHTLNTDVAILFQQTQSTCLKGFTFRNSYCNFRKNVLKELRRESNSNTTDHGEQEWLQFSLAS